MKKIATAILLSALLCLGLAACAPAEAPAGGGQNESFYAKIVSIEGDTVTAEALEDEWVLASAAQFTFSAADLPDIGAAVGSYVNLVFTGEIAESDPAQITVVDWSDISAQHTYPETTPPMTLFYGEESAHIGTFPPATWHYYYQDDGQLNDGTWNHIVYDDYYALNDEAEPLILPRNGDLPVVLLSELLLPDQITAVAWSEDVLALTGDYRLAEYENTITLETSGGYIYLPEDGKGYLVLATATWNDREDGKTPYGTANYLFRITAAE